MPSDRRHKELLAAAAVAALGAVGLLVLDGAAATAAGLVAVAVLGLLVFRLDRSCRGAEAECDRLDARLLELGDRDPLTGALRRKRLVEELRLQLALAQRNRSQVAVLALDLGGFDSAVDAYGRATGDELLLAAAEVLREELRASDLISRPRDDSFLVVLPESDEESARIVAGKLIRSLRGVKRAKPDGALIDLRASIGLTLSDPTGSSNSDELVEDAEEALEHAKREGGDRFLLSPAAALDSSPART